MRIAFIGSVIVLLVGILSPLFGDKTEGRSKDISQEILVAEDKSAQSSLCPTAFLKQHQQGVASWYGPGFHGKTMANGKLYDMESFTVAHRTLPLGTEVCITNLANGKSLQARVTDRGPYIPPRVLDVSKRIAVELDFLEKGLSEVVIATRT